MKKYYYILPTIIALALAAGIFVGGKLHFNDSPEKLFTTNSKKDKLNRLIDYWLHIALGAATWAIRKHLGLRSWRDVSPVTADKDQNNLELIAQENRPQTSN